MVDELKEHFDFQFDDRYHCKYCSYDTQLPNKALSHLQKKHSEELKAKAVEKPKKSSRPTAKKIEESEA